MPCYLGHAVEHFLLTGDMVDHGSGEVRHAIVAIPRIGFWDGLGFQRFQRM